ncbi:hypothetical protein OG522_31490 [Streptomyces sp. NBC_01431]|nr:hypothetical protein [Streptomyces sp. NBC_01431]
MAAEAPRPSRVATSINPSDAPGGTSTVNDVADAETTCATRPLNRTTLSVGAVANPEPEITTCAPATADVGANDETTGAGVASVNASTDCALTPATVTDTAPAFAPAGTVTTNRVAVADTTVAAVPPKDTALLAAVVEKPVPDSVTLAPAAARTGTTDRTDNWLEGKRSMPSRLPGGS